MTPLAPFVDLLAPRDCLGCEAPSDQPGALLCRACTVEQPLLPRSFAAPSPLAWAMGLGPYQGPLGALVRTGKYRPDPRVFDQLARWMQIAFRDRLPRADAVVAVPVPARRRLRRGFDQGQLLAHALAGALNLPLLPALTRARAAEQAGRFGRARSAGARGSFRARGVLPPRLILVDDVCTTGATASACGDELLAHGARSVGFVCVAAAAL